jgi:hypothetical protein
VFKAAQDYMNDYPETQRLALSLRRQPSYEQDIASRAGVPQLTRYLDSLKGATRDRVIKEFSDYFKAADNRQPLPAVSPEAQKAIDLARTMRDVTGKEAQALGVKVQQSDGTWRDIRLLGPDSAPRMFTADTQDIFDNRNGTRKAEFDAIVQRAIAQGKVKDRAEFESKFVRSTPDRSSNATFSNLEKAREAKLPFDFYDYSPHTMLRYANRAIKRLSQIRVYGQGIGAQGDMFDRAVQDIENSSRPKWERDAIISRIRSAQSVEYQQRQHGGFMEAVRGAQQMATAAFVGNPLSSARYLVTGTLQNLAYGGSTRFARAIGHLADIRNILPSLREAEDRGLLKNVLANTMRDYDERAPNFSDWSAQQMLKYMGHSAADNTNRMIGMLEAKYMLADFANKWASGKQDAASRAMYQMIARKGIGDLGALAAEKGQGPLSDEFIRQFDLDVHGSYGLGQAPSWIGHQNARVFFQFMRWGANSARIATQEFVMPFAKSLVDFKNNPSPATTSAVGYHFMRALGFLAAGAVSGELTNAFRQFVTGKSPNDPDWNEIANAILKGNYGNALTWAMKREADMLILGGFTGTWGESYAQIPGMITNPAATINSKNPLDPRLLSGCCSRSWHLPLDGLVRTTGWDLLVNFS